MSSGYIGSHEIHWVETVSKPFDFTTTTIVNVCLRKTTCDLVAITCQLYSDPIILSVAQIQMETPWTTTAIGIWAPIVATSARMRNHHPTHSYDSRVRDRHLRVKARSNHTFPSREDDFTAGRFERRRDNDDRVGQQNQAQSSICPTAVLATNSIRNFNLSIGLSKSSVDIVLSMLSRILTFGCWIMDRRCCWC